MTCMTLLWFKILVAHMKCLPSCSQPCIYIMNTWYMRVCSITHWHFFPAVAYVVSVIYSHLLLCFVIRAFGLCLVSGVGKQRLSYQITHLKVCFQIWERLQIGFYPYNVAHEKHDHAICVIEARKMIESTNILSPFQNKSYVLEIPWT